MSECSRSELFLQIVPATFFRVARPEQMIKLLHFFIKVKVISMQQMI